jgi:ATP adenylyltransferase
MSRDASALPSDSPSDLAARVAERFRVSGESGARLELESREEVVVDRRISFVVRVLAPRLGAAARRAKDAARARGAVAGGAAPADAVSRSPFLPPYDPALLIGAVTPSHVCLLNKYNIVDRHLLIVTREYEPQESPLTDADFAAARICLEAIDGLVFYNSEAAAGASQSHKHLQLVPFPLGPGGERFPLDHTIASTLGAGLDGARELGFRHRIARLGSAADCEIYRALAASCGLFAESAGDRHGLAAYNLLMTRDWMLVVPRSSGATGTIEVNALGFAGLLAVRGDDDLAAVRAAGPLEILARVGVRWS